MLIYFVIAGHLSGKRHSRKGGRENEGTRIGSAWAPVADTEVCSWTWEFLLQSLVNLCFSGIFPLLRLDTVTFPESERGEALKAVFSKV